MPILALQKESSDLVATAIHPVGFIIIDHCGGTRPSGIANPNLHKEAFGASEASHVSLEEPKEPGVDARNAVAVLNCCLAFASSS